MKLLQWSDSHASTNNISATQNALNTANDRCTPIHCGDLVNQYFESGISNTDLSKTLCVIGNHDAITRDGTIGPKYDWTKQPTQSQLRARYIDPLIASFGVSSEDSFTWWSKHIDGFMLVGLNDTVMSSTVANSQAEWMRRIIAQCESSSTPIVIIKHSAPVGEHLIECNFTSNTAKTRMTPEIESYNDTYSHANDCVNIALSSNATVLCVLHGHGHYDSFGYVKKQDGTYVPSIGINSTLVDSYGDVSRSTDVNNAASVALNQIEFDRNLNTMRVYRLGCDNSALGCYRKMLVYSYETNGIVSSCSNRGMI